MFISSYVLHNNKCKSISTEHPNIYSKNNAKNFGDRLRVFRCVASLTGFPAPFGRRFYQYCMPGGILRSANSVPAVRCNQNRVAM